MSTIIEIYPKVRKPKWLTVGSVVEVLGEGSGIPHIVTAIDDNGFRAAVQRIGGGYDWWESWKKLEQFSFTRERINYAIERLEAELEFLKAADKIGRFRKGLASEPLNALKESIDKLKKVGLR